MRATDGCGLAMCVLTVAVAIDLGVVEAARRRALPPAVAKAVKEAFPEATVTSFGRERERGVMYYEVSLRDHGNRIEVEVAPDGSIGEIEAVVDMADVPAGVTDQIRRATRGGRILRVEKHERRGVGRGGRFVPLDRPRTFYEVKYSRNGRRREIIVRHTEAVKLPGKARIALKAAFPRAKIGDAYVEGAKGAKLFKVTVTRGRRAQQVVLSAEGAIVEVRTALPAAASLPKKVGAAMRKAGADARLTAVERVEVRAVVQAGKPTVLKQPKVVYRGELLKGSSKAVVVVSPEGALVEAPQWQKMHDEDDEDDDDDDG
jgi:hypothetical protein